MFYTDLTPFGVDMERLAKQRLERLQQAMKQHGLGALMLTDHQNIRYATNSVFMLSLRATAIQRFVLVPANGAPLICQKNGAKAGQVATLWRVYVRYATADSDEGLRCTSAGWLAGTGIGA